MAARESDAALWLHNKLGSTDDLWSGRSICSQLTQERLVHIQDCFINLQPHVKVKLLLSFIHLPRRNIEEWKMELDELIDMAINDGDQWVSMIGEILRTYPSTMNLNCDVEDNNPTFHEVLNDLKKTVKKAQDVSMLPLECLFLNRSSLTQMAGHQPQPPKHFALKRKPKSAALRAELLQKSSEAASQPKKFGFSNNLPIKVRSFAKKMNDTTPLKGIPSRTPGSGGFRTPTTPTSGRFSSGTPLVASHSTPLGGTRPVGGLRKEGGIKLLDITEQPVGLKEAKRRKKQQEMEAIEVQKKEKEVAATTPVSVNQTPDYAAALMSPAMSRPPPSPAPPTLSAPPTPSYLPPAGSTRLPSTSNGVTTTSPATNLVSTATKSARENLQLQLQQQLGQSNIRTQPAVQPAVTSAPAPVPTAQPMVVNPPAQTPPPVQPAAAPAPAGATKKGLSLTREQMVEAQEMFRTSNKVTRPEKALILGFMAGSRENPCPQHGDLVNIRLSEDLQIIQQQDGTMREMIVDTYFQMNYSTGTWQRSKKYRPKKPS